MVFAHQIREVVALYLSKDLDANEFLKRFSLLSFNIRKDSNIETVRLADSIELALIDFRGRCITEVELRSSLRALTHAADANTIQFPLTFPVSINQISLDGTAFPGTAGTSGTSRGVEFGSAVSLQ